MPLTDSLRWFYARARQADPHLGLRHALKDPLRDLRHVRIGIRGIAKYGREAEELWGMSPLRQFLVYLPLLLRFGHSIEEFYLYRFCLSEWRSHAESFLPGRRMRALDRLYEQIGVDIGMLEDKARFGRLCTNAGLPVIPTILEIDPTGLRWGETIRDRRLPAEDLIVKPRTGLAGNGVRAFESVSDGYRDEAGRVQEAQALIDSWSEESRKRPLIVQPRLRNASEVSTWSTGAVCSVRLVTSRRAGENPAPLLGLFRMPSGDTVADNISRGGVAAPLDLASGELGPARSLKITEAMRRTVFERHPKTGARIAGRQLPLWNDIVQLGLRAHGNFGGFHSVGWDIAITDDGPVLIEGNHDWGVMISQFPGPAPLGLGRLPDDIRHCFETASEPRT